MNQEWVVALKYRRLIDSAFKCSLRFLGAILAQILFIPKYSVSATRTVAKFLAGCLAIILIGNVRSGRTISVIRARLLSSGPVLVDAVYIVALR